MKNNNKLIIFDWGGVVESHCEGEYNDESAFLAIMKHFNIGDKEKLAKFISCCYNNESNVIIGETNKIEDVQKWFYKIKEYINNFINM